MTELGQTDNYSLSDHIEAIIEHVGKGIIDICICDTGEVTPEFVRRYNKMGADLVEQDIEKAKEKEVRIIKKNMSCIKNEKIRHNPDMIASTIMDIICTDLKYRDKQDEQYMLINTKLQKEKKKQKSNNKVAKHKKEKEPKREKKQSKFINKYSERIESIQTSENKRQENRRLLEKSEEKKNK